MVLHYQPLPNGKDMYLHVGNHGEGSMLNGCLLVKWSVLCKSNYVAYMIASFFVKKKSIKVYLPLSLLTRRITVYIGVVDVQAQFITRKRQRLGFLSFLYFGMSR